MLFTRTSLLPGSVSLVLDLRSPQATRRTSAREKTRILNLRERWEFATAPIQSSVLMPLGDVLAHARHQILLVTGMMSAACTLVLPYIPGAADPAFDIGMALFFTYLAGNSGWGLVQAIAPPGMVGSVATIQNFGSFVCASFAPVIAGWLLDHPLIQSNLENMLPCISSRRLSYLLIVKDPIVVRGSDAD